jgi:acyl-CoA reductase-like NAD-dependent aldehyde dehydrogenase
MSNRLEILKTYKLYINGQFPRTESGRYYVPLNPKGEKLGNICLASRKDFRNAVVAARKAQSSWAGRSAYNIGQIIYRIAENLEARKEEFVRLLVQEGAHKEKTAQNTVEKSIDNLVYYAGWADKFQQVYSSVNPVASSHFNFSVLEPMGVISILLDAQTDFSDWISTLAACICGGNTVVLLAEEKMPLSAISFAEVLQHSDVPGGVINILTGKREELQTHFASHMDVNGLLLLGDDFDFQQLEQASISNLKRVIKWPLEKIRNNACSPAFVKGAMEVKTTWHPIEQIGGATAGY